MAVHFPKGSTGIPPSLASRRIRRCWYGLPQTASPDRRPGLGNRAAAARPGKPAFEVTGGLFDPSPCPGSKGQLIPAPRMPTRESLSGAGRDIRPTRRQGYLTERLRI